METPTKKERSRSQEDAVAKDVGGRVQAGSGNQPGKPGDVKHERFLIECKTTESKSFRVSRELINKIESEAQSMNREWALVIEFQGRQVVVVDYDAFLEMVET